MLDGPTKIWIQYLAIYASGVYGLLLLIGYLMRSTLRLGSLPRGKQYYAQHCGRIAISLLESSHDFVHLRKSLPPNEVDSSQY